MSLLSCGYKYAIFIINQSKRCNVIKTDKIKVIIYPSNINYWSSKLNKTLELGKEIEVSFLMLPPKSNKTIECICDECERTFIQRRSRDLSVCGHCKTKKRLTGNTLGSANKKYDIPSKNELESLIEEGKGKQSLSRIYKTTIPVIDRWLKKYSINLPSYYGRKYFKNDIDYQQSLEKIKNCIENQSMKTISEIHEETKIPRHIIKKIEKENSLRLPTFFTEMENQYDHIIQNLSFLVEENKTKTLKAIAEEQSISIEQLKKAFRENNMNVRTHSYNKSKGEIECRDFIRSLGYECDSYNFLKKFEIDCFVPSKQFGVEYCGEFWHRYEPHKNNKNYHQTKFDFFAEKNVRLFTIFENEWKSHKKREIIQSMIAQRLQHSSVRRIGARSCGIMQIDKKSADEFHTENHISGKTTSSINFGLFNDNELQMVLSLVKSRFDKNFDYEISRLSTKKYTIVVGGFSKLFNFFIKNYDLDSCLTYADLRFGEGKVYEKSGFEFVGKTIPNYHYYDKTIGIMENRMKYQKQKLKKMNLKCYDDRKTEFEIMKEMGFYRLYDCGNNKYKWERK